MSHKPKNNIKKIRRNTRTYLEAFSSIRNIIAKFDFFSKRCICRGKLLIKIDIMQLAAQATIESDEENILFSDM